MRKRLEAYKISTTEVEKNIAEKQRQLAKMKKATETLEAALKAAEEAFGGSGSGGPSPSTSQSVDRRHGGVVTKPHRGRKYRGRGKNNRGSHGGRGRGGFGPPGRGGFGSGGITWWNN